jgi:integrase
MHRDEIKIGQVVRILTKWHDVAAGTVGTIDSVTSRWDDTKVFTVRWHTSPRKNKTLYQNTFEQAWTEFEAWFVKEKRPLTVRTYRECGRRLKESYSGKRLSQISTMAVQEHKHNRKKAGAPVRGNREVAVLKKFFNYCLEHKLFEGTNPVTSVKFFPEPRGKDRVLSQEEEAALLAKCREPLRTMILFGIYCGVRMRSELLTLRWENVDLAHRTLTIIGAYAKNGRARTLCLNSVVHDALTRHPHPPKAEWVFTSPRGTPYKSIRTGFNAACKAAGLKGVTPHTLRHTFASRLMENGVDPIMVTKLAGWSSIKMLDRYAHADPSRMAEAVERLVPSKVPPSKSTKFVTA